MALSAIIFPIICLLALMNRPLQRDAPNELTMIMIFAVVAIGTTILTSLGYLKQKEIKTIKKIIRIAVTVLIMTVIMIAILYMSIFALLALLH